MITLPIDAEELRIMHIDGAPMDSSGSCVPTATTWTETVPESHANGGARPTREPDPLSSASDIQTGYERFVHLAGRPGKRR